MSLKSEPPRIEYARHEFITRGTGAFDEVLADGVEILVFVAESKGAKNLCTAMATIRPCCKIPYHTHPCGEVILPLTGRLKIKVEDRSYELSRYDAMYVPAGCPHSVENNSPDEVRVHVSFPDGSPQRDVIENFDDVHELQIPPASAPESLRRMIEAKPYELAANTCFYDLFASRFGSRGICGGYGVFQPGSSLPCHVHSYDESISIVEGEAICQVAGKEYRLTNYDTASIPRGRPHRFINRSSKPMAMIWVYAGDEPDRDLVEQSFCEGAC